MEFIPYSCQTISETDIAAVCDVLRSEYLTQGPATPTFEGAFAARHGVAHAVAVCNATAGLHIACLALGVKIGSRVWTSPNSFLASANCALYCGAVVDFVDIDRKTRNMSVGCLSSKLVAAKKAGTLPDVVIPVDFSGLSCDLQEMRELADKYGFKILKDASHATGATYQNCPVGSMYADISVFSLHAVKVITTGEGGVVTTQDAAIAKKLRQLRSHGITREASEMEREPDGPWSYEQHVLGYNLRMTDMQAALGLSQLARMDVMLGQREALVQRYEKQLCHLPLILPTQIPDRTSSWHLYCVEIDKSRTTKSRAEMFKKLRADKIGVNVHYIPIHTQPYYTRLGFKRGDFPNSEQYYDQALSIPLFPSMTEGQQDRVMSSLAEGFS
jgi:UDP-4-amino-4,6-dideoxy-N-acetyl-beta-L-altrosamine transaminase